jgi:hypothetical protein
MSRFIPSGQLVDGSRGLPIDKTSNLPTAAAIEILDALPDVNSTQNYPGRTVFSTAAKNIYSFTDDPANEWIAIKESQVEVGAAEPSGSDLEGALYYSTNTKILYVYVGSAWVAIAGEMGSGVIWRHYTGDGVTSLYPTGSSQQPPVEYVQVYIDGVAQQPGANGVRDYYMIGNDAKLNAVPSNGSAISIRTLVHASFERNARFFARRYVADGTANEFDTGAQLMEAGQAIVTLNGVVQSVDTGNGNGTYDYKIATANNNVSSLTSTGTTATMISEEAHGYSNGDPITILGADQAEYNVAGAAVTVVNATTLTYTMASDPGVSPATGSNIIFGPVKSNDKIRFYDASGNLSAPANGLVVYIQSAENLITSLNS